MAALMWRSSEVMEPFTLNLRYPNYFRKPNLDFCRFLGLSMDRELLAQKADSCGGLEWATDFGFGIR
jgi:hypothetical protein